MSGNTKEKISNRIAARTAGGCDAKTNTISYQFKSLTFYVVLAFQNLLCLPSHIGNMIAPYLWPYTVYKGIKIIDPQDTTRESFTKLIEEGLICVSNHDPRRFERICREIKIIMHIPTYSGACYERPSKVCSIDGTVYELAKHYHGSVAALACILVHESVHGYLYTKRIIQTKKNFSRVEEACNREMLRFARRIDFDTEGWVEGPVIPTSFLTRKKFAWDKIKQLWSN